MDQLVGVGWEIFGHSDYSPDLAPNDFFLFPQLKKSLGGCRFTTDTPVKKKNINLFFHQQPPEFFKAGMHGLVKYYCKVFGLL